MRLFGVVSAIVLAFCSTGCGQPGGVGAERDDYPVVDPVEQYVKGVRYDYSELKKSGRDTGTLGEIISFSENMAGYETEPTGDYTDLIRQIAELAAAGAAAYEAGNEAEAQAKVDAMKPLIDQLPKYDD